MNKNIFLIIFILSLFSFSNVLAATSPDGCVSWTDYCESDSVVAVNLSWSPLTQIDINNLRRRES
jgi:hypothetical protein